MTTISEEYKLPSGGKIYTKQFDPIVRLRSMTVEDEMKRCNTALKPYKAMCDILDTCLESKIPYSTYDLCLADYQYLIHKLRIVTYGSKYQMTSVCPVCGAKIDNEVDLTQLHEKTITEDILGLLEFDLPVSGDRVKIKMQTPRDLDNISIETEELQEKFPDMPNPISLIVLKSLIETINGKPLDKVFGLEKLKQMSARDMNKILKRAERINNELGVNISVDVKCPKCGLKTKTGFRYTDEFFRPTED